MTVGRVDLEPGSDAYRTVVASAMLTNVLCRALEVVLDVPAGARCVQTTRVLVDLLTAEGVPARPLAVDVVVTNSVHERLARQGVPPDEMHPLAHSIGVVAPSPAPRPSDGRWDGHLIARVARRWIVDADAGSFDRPGRVRMPGWWMMPWPDEWTAKGGGWHVFGMGTDTTGPSDPTYALVRLRPRSDNLWWAHGSGWDPAVASDPLLPAARSMLRRLRDGDLPDTVGVSVAGRAVNVDTVTLKRRWEDETTRPPR